MEVGTTHYLGWQFYVLHFTLSLHVLSSLVCIFCL